MAAHRKRSRTGTDRRNRQLVNSAIASGRAAAEEVLEFRAKQRKKRTAIAKRTPVVRRAPVQRQIIPKKTLGFLGPKAQSGVLIAEGDSWFDYPRWDVLKILEDTYLFDVQSVAHRGDCVEDMAHSSGQFEELARRLEKLLLDAKVPRAILLSGGGNDIAGDELAVLLNHASSGLPELNEDIIHGVIDVRLRAAYVRLITGVTTIAKHYLNRPIPIIVHGYDYPVPDGRGFLGGWWVLPGPWLKPGFERKGYKERDKNAVLIGQIIDRFNDMVSAVSTTPEFQHVHYLDLRGTLRHDASYKNDWENELHPNERGFGTITARFAKLIGQI